ncbi:MAG: NAD(+)/NADH kinase [Kiritimatiellae bacterium]|nr:NAD(+)/NADH kinase [Kiritimatiellia bacterium]
MKKMKKTRIRFFVNSAKRGAGALAEKLSRVAAGLGLETVPDAEADIVVALGGDGTILRAVHEFPGVPVLGFNIGGLGFLSGVGAGEFESALAKLAKGGYCVSARSMLSVAGRVALNEVVVMREMTGHAALLEVAVGGKRPTVYMADGIVVATPTGSTAYSLSAGGPVLMPDTGNIVITPMNPHALGVRPVVVCDSVKLVVSSVRRLGAGEEKVGVYLDGEAAMMLGAGESIEISKAPEPALFVELDGYDPYEVLSRKLGWSGTNLK